MKEQKDEKIVVQSLIGGSQLPFYLLLKSLIAFCHERIPTLHTDSTLSKKQRFHP